MRSTVRLLHLVAVLGVSVVSVVPGAVRAEVPGAPAEPTAPVAPIVEGDRAPTVDAAAAEIVQSAEQLRDDASATPPPTTTPAPTTLVLPPPLSGPGFWDDGQPGHYLAWYGAEYAAVGALAGLYLADVHELITPAPALIGPRVDLDNVDLAVIMDPRLDSTIGKPFLKEQVPSSALIGVAAISILGTAGLDLAATGDLHRTNGLVLGGLEALMGTVLITEVFKLSFGRLRPDFRDRYLHAACGGNIDAPAGLDCSAVDDRFTMSEQGVKEGMKSFVSGHSSSAFAIATFSSWWLGSTLVWGEDRPAWGPAVGALSMGTLMAGAGYVASTRLSDNKHHPEDVVVGSLLGATVATTAWLVHFDIDGRARRRSFTVVPQLGMGQTGTANGLALAGSLP